MSRLLDPGKYIVAVSGGVDSVVLLHMLNADKNLQLIVAHFDHGIRPDSAEDARFVKALAKNLDLPFVCEREELGPDASEATARTHRYSFLNKTKEKFNADAIVTAHHQDDLIETALLNVIRGTKRRGFVSLKSNETVKRPLLSMTKKEILKYARMNNLKWREDSTNSEMQYKRNQIRAAIAKTLTDEKKQKIISLLKKIEKQNRQIEEIVSQYLVETPKDELLKSDVKSFSAPEGQEIITDWLRNNNVGFDAKTVERIFEGAQTLQNGAQIDVQQGYYVLLSKDKIILRRR